jgi:hypothetical protein
MVGGKDKRLLFLTKVMGGLRLEIIGVGNRVISAFKVLIEKQRL